MYFMIKQSNIYTGLELDPVEKYNLQNERKEKVFADLQKEIGLQIVDDFEIKKNIFIEEGMIIRTNSHLFKVQYFVKDFIKGVSLFDKKECFIERQAIRNSSYDILEILKKGDIIFVKNENGIILKCMFLKFENNKKYQKICVRDLADNAILVLDKIAFHRVIKLKEGC